VYHQTLYLEGIIILIPPIVDTYSFITITALHCQKTKGQDACECQKHYVHWANSQL